MVNTVTPQQAAQWLANGDAILIDVREADEFSAEHIAYANSLPLSKLDSLLPQLGIPASRKVIFQCQKGGRGQTACANAGSYSDITAEIYNLEGGLNAWKAENLPVILKKTGLPIFRQVQIIAGGLIAFFTILGFIGLTFGFIIAGVIGTALCFAGLTGWCGLAMLLSVMPWNKAGNTASKKSCDAGCGGNCHS